MAYGSALMAAAAPPSSATTGAHLARGNLDLRMDLALARWRGRAVNLTHTELKMIYLLAQRIGTGVSYRELYDLVHGPGFMAGKGTAGYRANVRAFIKRIRRKFRDVDGDFAAISNMSGFGYRWADREEG